MKATTRLKQCPEWQNLETALNHRDFVAVLTRRCARFTHDPEQVSGITLVILCLLAGSDRYDPGRGSVMAFALGVARRVAANTRRREARQRTSLPYEPCTDRDSILGQLIVCELLDLLLTEISTYSPADQDLLWRGCRCCDDMAPMNGTERCRLHRLRKRLASVVDYPY